MLIDDVAWIRFAWLHPKPCSTRTYVVQDNFQTFSTRSYGTNNPLTGIDNFAWTAIHESQHYKDWCDFWDVENQGTAKWLAAKGKQGPNDDLDGDRIPNSTEDVNLNGIYDTGDLYDWQVYNTPTANRPAIVLNDFEDWDCQRHTDEKGNHSKDWANPGMQHKTLDKYDD